MASFDVALARLVLDADTSRLAAGLAAAESQVAKAGRRMQELGTELSAKVSLPILAIGGFSTHMAVQFDDSLKKMQALVGIQRDQIEAWTDDIRNMAIQYGSSASEAADAMFFITSAGLRGSDAMETLDAALKGSAIGLGEVKTVADAATSAMNAYAEVGLSATRATEILTAAVRTGKLEAQDLAPVIGGLSGFASALDISFEAVAGTLAVFSRTGTDAAEGATQLRSIMSTLLGTSKEGEVALEKAGLSLAKLREVAADGPGGLIQVMRILEKTFGNNVDQLRVIVPNLRAFRGVMTALAQAPEAVNQVIKDTANSVGILDEALLAAEGPGLQLARSWARLKDALISIGNAIMPVVVPAVTAFAKVIHGLAKGFESLHPAVKFTITLLGGIAAAMGPALVGVGAFLKLMPFLKAALAGIALKATLWIAAFAAVGAAAVAVVENWDWLKQQAIALWTFITQAFLRGAQKVLGVIADLTILTAPGISRWAMNLQASMGAAAEAGLAEAGAALAALEAKIMGTANVTKEAGNEMEEAFAKLQAFLDSLDADTGGGDGVKAVTEALNEFAAANTMATQMHKLFGNEFDVTAAKADALETVIQKLIAAGVDLGLAVGANGESIRDFANQLKNLREEMIKTEEEQQKFQNMMQLVNTALNNAIDPAETYQRTLAALAAAFLLGWLTIEEFNKALEGAKKMLEESAEKQDEFTESVNRFRDQAIDAIVEFAMTGKQNFAEFIHSALQELAKLVIKLEILRAIESGLGGSFLGINFGGLFQHGGIIRPGEVGIVGEAGPELVSGGTSGVAVAPMGNVASAGGGGGDQLVMPVSINVQAVDAQGVAQFFEANEALVANAMLRAQQKSSVLRRRL